MRVLALDESNVEGGRVEVDELEEEDLRGERIVVRRLRSVVLCSVVVEHRHSR